MERGILAPNSEQRRSLAGLRNETIGHLLFLEGQKKTFSLSNDNWRSWEDPNSSAMLCSHAVLGPKHTVMGMRWGRVGTREVRSGVFTGWSV